MLVDCIKTLYNDSRNIVKSNYMTLVKIHHPDKGGDPANFRKVLLWEDYKKLRR